MKQNLNIMRFHSSKAAKYTNRDFSQGNATPINCIPRALLPFQVDIPRGSGLLTKFELTNLDTDEVFDELASVYLQRSGTTESYENASLTVLDATSTKSAWGFSIGNPQKLRNVKVTIHSIFNRKNNN